MTSAGELVEAQRTRDTLSLLKKRLYVASLGELESFDRTLDIALLLVRGSRMGKVLVLDEARMEAVLLTERDAAIRMAPQNVTKSDTAICLAALQQADSFTPAYLAEKGGHEWVCCELLVPAGFCWKHETKQRRFVAAVARTFNQFTAAGAVEVSFFVETLRTLSQAMEVAWQRELRVRQRKELFKDVERLLFSSRSLSVPEICSKVLQAIGPAAPGCCLYVGLLEEQASVIAFRAATPQSEMLDKILRRGQGISFDCVETLETLQINAEDTSKARFLLPGASVQCLYGRRAYRGLIHAVRGHEKFDVRFLELDEKVEAGVDISRITPAHTAFRMRLLGKGPPSLPFIVLPLRNLLKGIGVLGFDSMSRLPRAPYDPSPEPPLLLFLQQVGKLLGAHVDGQRKRLALKSIIKVSRNSNATVEDIFEAVFAGVFSVLPYVDAMLAVRVVYEASEVFDRGIRVIRREGRAVAASAVVTSSSSSFAAAAAPAAASAASTVSAAASSATPPARRAPGPAAGVLAETEARLQHFHPKRSNLKPLQAHGSPPHTAWLVFKLRADMGAQSRIYIVSVEQQHMSLPQPDLDFLETVQKIVHRALQAIHAREAQGDLKVSTLEEIRLACLKWRTTDRSRLFGFISDRVQQVYYSANLYVGRFGPMGQELKFFLASPRSAMVGNAVRRGGRTVPVTIAALDAKARIAVTPDMELAGQLQHFGPQENFEYPFVAVPLVAHVDAVVGVLCADACEDPAAEADDSTEVTPALTSTPNLALFLNLTLNLFLTNHHILSLFRPIKPRLITPPKPTNLNSPLRCLGTSALWDPTYLRLSAPTTHRTRARSWTQSLTSTTRSGRPPDTSRPRC